jgi:hypothetical protein
LTTPTYKLSFCCNSGSDRKTQPYYWLATDHNKKDKTKKQSDRKGKEKLKERTTGKTYEQLQEKHVEVPFNSQDT